MNDELLLAEAVSVALRHIGIATYSSGKIYNYLQQKGYPSAVCRLAVDELVEREFINDFKAARKVLNSRKGTKQESKYYIGERLKAAGIASNVIYSIVDDLPSDTDTCVSLFDSTYSSIPDSDPFEFIQSAIKLANKRGYSAETARKSLSIWMEQK